MRTLVLPALALCTISVPASSSEPSPVPEIPVVRGDVLTAVENELERLARQAGEESGPVHPRPSSEVAFLLLTGLAARSNAVDEPDAKILSQLGVTPGNTGRLRVFDVADDARIVIRGVAIQDKAGTWTSQTATLYRLRGEKWVVRGQGSTAE